MGGITKSSDNPRPSAEHVKSVLKVTLTDEEVTLERSFQSVERRRGGQGGVVEVPELLFNTSGIEYDTELLVFPSNRVDAVASASCLSGVSATGRQASCKNSLYRAARRTNAGSE